MSKIQIDAESISKALADGKPTSLTGLWKAITGKKTSVPGSVASKIREMVPDIMDRLTANKPEGTSASMQKTKPARQDKKPTPKSTGFKSTKFPRHEKNPFRPGSGYGLLTDIITSAGSNGIAKDEVIKAYCKITGKDETHARYDLAVILSASTDSERKHRSCRDGFSVLREGDNLRIKFG